MKFKIAAIAARFQFSHVSAARGSSRWVDGMEAVGTAVNRHGGWGRHWGPGWAYGAGIAAGAAAAYGAYGYTPYA